MKNPYSELPSPEKCGWLKLEESTYSFDWECPKIQSQVKDTIDFLTKGCSCKKGCHSNHCHCRKKVIIVDQDASVTVVLTFQQQI